MAPKRATPQEAFLRFGFQIDGESIPYVGNPLDMSFNSWPVSHQQEFTEATEAGGGADPNDPDPGPIDVTGSSRVPIDEDLWGYWLKLALGAPLSSVQVGARGYIVFPANPSDGQTIELGGDVSPPVAGTVWTFVTAAPAANQTQIGADLKATLGQLATDLNASVDPKLTVASYTGAAQRLEIQHGTPDATGNNYAVVTTIPGAKVSFQSGPGVGRLAGGGLYRHEFHSGRPPEIATTEINYSDMGAGVNKVYVQPDIKINTITINMSRGGPGSAELDIRGLRENIYQSTQMGTPVIKTVKKFNNLRGDVLIDEVCGANITDFTVVYGNNLSIVESLCNDGHIGGADPGIRQLGYTSTVRFSDEEQKRAAESEVPISLIAGYDNMDGAEFRVQYHRVFLPRPSRTTEGGAGGVEASYAGTGAKDPSLGRAATFTVWNSTANFDNPA